MSVNWGNTKHLQHLSLRKQLCRTRQCPRGSSAWGLVTLMPLVFPSFPSAKVLETAFISLFPKSNPAWEKIIKHGTYENLLQKYIIRLDNLRQFPTCFYVVRPFPSPITYHIPVSAPDCKCVVFWLPSPSPFKIGQFHNEKRVIFPSISYLWINAQTFHYLTCS